MRTHPRLLLALLPALAFGACDGPARAATPPPLVLLFPRGPGNAADVRALVKLRTRLRADQRLSVLTFDSDAPSVVRAATDAHHPEWLTDSVASDSARLDIARAVGASFAAVVGDAGRGKVDVHLLEASAAARVRDYADSPADKVADAMERDAFTPAPAAPALPPPAAVPSLVRPAPSPPLVAPPVVAPPVVAPPVVAPPVVAPPVVAPPVARPTPAPLEVPAASAPNPEGARQPVLPPSLPAPPSSGAATHTPPMPDPTRAARNAADLAAVQPLIAQGDRAIVRGAMVEAYSFYRDAINGAPLSDVPRLKLAQAYLLGGLSDKALDEAQRALEVAPDSAAIQEFLIKYDADNGTSIGATARYKALAAKDPQDPTAHLDLGDALWNDGIYADAEAEYKTARDLAPADSLGRHIALAHLARLYAAMGRDSDCLSAMKGSGGLAYPLVLGVVQGDVDTLTASMDAAHAGFDADKVTRQDFYAKIKADCAQAQALADFVAKITPPDAYSRSHLDRVQSVTLLAQSAAVLQTFIETSDLTRRDKAMQLEKDAQAEMLTAHAAEQKLGLWGGRAQVGEGL